MLGADGSTVNTIVNVLACTNARPRDPYSDEALLGGRSAECARHLASSQPRRRELRRNLRHIDRCRRRCAMSGALIGHGTVPGIKGDAAAVAEQGGERPPEASAFVGREMMD